MTVTRFLSVLKRFYVASRILLPCEGWPGEAIFLHERISKISASRQKCIGPQSQLIFSGTNMQWSGGNAHLTVWTAFWARAECDAVVLSFFCVRVGTGGALLKAQPGYGFSPATFPGSTSRNQEKIPSRFQESRGPRQLHDRHFLSKTIIFLPNGMKVATRNPLFLDASQPDEDNT